MTKQETIDLYVKAVDLAMKKEGLSNQEKMLLNRFKILLLSGAVEDANSGCLRLGGLRGRLCIVSVNWQRVFSRIGYGTSMFPIQNEIVCLMAVSIELILQESTC